MSSYIKTIDDAVKSAVYSKFRSYFGLTSFVNDIVFAPKEIQQRKIAEKRGNDSVEFIGVWRRNMKFDWNRNKYSVAHHGLMLEYATSEKKTIITAKAVPVSMDYDIWFWTRDYDKMMQATEAYLFWQFNNPNLILNYMDRYPMEMDMHFFGGVVDESPYNQTYDKGTYFVSKMGLTLDGWIFTSLSSYTILSIILRVWVRETATDVSDEILGAGGSPSHRTGNLARKPIEDTISITDGVETFTDDGEGLLTSDTSGGTDGTIDYYTGAYDITFASTPAGNILADYQNKDTLANTFTITSDTIS